MSDTAANVVTNLAGLQTRAAAGGLASITLTDTGTPTLTLTAAQLVANAAALLKIGGSYPIAVAGQATAAQAAAISSTLATKISNGLAVSDTAANVVTNLAGLQARAAAGKLSSITLTDGGTPALTLTATQLSGNATALLKIGGNYTVTMSGQATAAQAVAINSTLAARISNGLAVSDTAANVNGNLDGLLALATAGKLTSIALTDSGAPVLHLAAAQVITYLPMLAKVVGNYGLDVTTSATAAQAVAVPGTLLPKLTANLTVSDTAANIVPRLDSLQSLYAAGKLSSISISDATALSVTAATLAADSGVLAAIQGPYALTIASGALTVAQAISLNSGATSHLRNGLALLDSAANVAAALDTLQSLAGMIGSVALTGSGTPTLTITPQQLGADADILLKVTGAFALAVSGTATVAQAQSAATQGLLARVTGGAAISDTAANVTAGLDALQALGGAVASIALAGGGTPALSLSATQLAADAPTLLKIGTPYTLALSGALSVAQAQAAQAQGLLTRVTGGAAISDTAANVQAALGALLGLGSQVAAIALTDTGTPTISVTASDLVADNAVLARISGSWTLSVSSGAVTAAQATALGSAVTTHLSAGLTVSDTASNITAALANLQALGATVASIALTDTGTPALSLTAAQLVANATTLLKINGAFGIAVTGPATAAQAAAANSVLLTKLTNSGLTVLDSAANVTTQLDGLQANSGRIASITLNDSSTPTISVSATTLLADSAALGEIVSSYNLAVTSGTLSTAQVVTLNAAPSVVSHLTASVNVSDTAANVVAHVADLASLGSALAAIALTDTGMPTLSVTAAQLIANAAVWLKIGGSYGITVSGTATATQAVAVNSTLANKLTTGLAVSATAADVNSNLDALQARGASVASIALTDTGTPSLSLTAAQLVADAPTLLKVSGAFGIAVAGNATAAQAAAANSALVGKLASGLAVSDSAANVAASLDGLQSLVAAGKLASVTLTDTGAPTLSVSAATLAADAGALALVGGNWTLGVSAGSVTAAQAIALGSSVTAHLASGLAVADTAANITASLAGLQALGGAVASIALTDTGGVPALTLTPAQVIANAATLLKISSPCNISLSGAATAAQAAGAATALAQKILSGFVVSDTAANVVANLDGLQARNAATQLASITLTDSGTPTLSVNAATLVNDAATLALIGGAWRLSLSSGSVTAAQALALSSGVTAHLASGLAVSDTAANVRASLASLQALGSTVASVALAGSPASFAVTADQLWHNAGILAKVSAGGAALVADTGNTASAAAAANLGSAPAYTGALLFADSAANIAGALDSLQALAAAGHLGAVTLTSTGTPTLSLTATQLANDAAALAMIGGSYALSVTAGTLTAAQALAIGSAVLAHLSAAVPVNDSAANILASLDALQARAGAIASVTFSNPTPPTLSLSPAQLTSDIAVLSLASGYSLSVSGTLTAAQATTLSPTSVVSRLATGPVVSDTAANISSSLAPLMTLANAGKLGSITLTDSGTPSLSVTPAQLSGNVAVLRKINSNYTLAPTTPLTADQAASVNPLLVSKLPSNLAVSDTAAHVLNDLDILETLAVGNHLGSVTLIDTGTPVLQLTGDQVTSDAAVLARITGNYQLNIMGGITAAQAAIFATSSTQLASSVNVVDAASAVASNMTSLQTLAAAGRLSSVAFTNSGTPNLTLAASVFAASATALGAIVGNYTITLSGTLTVAQTQAAATAGLLAHVPAGAPVGDTAANVQAALDALKLLGNAVASIALTDSGTPTLTVPAATLLADASVLALISGSNWNLAVTPGTLTAAQATALSGTITSRLSPGLALSDTVAHVTGSLAALQGLGAAVGSIALTDTSPVLSLTATQFVANAPTLQKITGTYGITLSGALTVAQAQTEATLGLLSRVTGGVAISDTAAAVQAGLSQLHGYGSAIASVTLTDSATPTITVAPADLISNASTLALVGGAWNLAVTGAVTAAQASALPAAVTTHLSLGLALSDTAAHIAASIDALQGLGGTVASIALNDSGTPAVPLTATQLVADASTLQKIAAPFSITLSGTLTVAQAQAAHTQGLLTRVTGGAAISDTAANVQAALGALLGLGIEVASIALSDTGTPTISVTASDLVADNAVLAKIGGAWHLAVSSGAVTAAQAAGLSSTVTTHLSGGLAVSDSASNIISGLDALRAVVGTIASITLTDAGTPNLSIPASTLVSDMSVLALVGGLWSLTVSSGAVTATQALALNTTVTARLSAGVTVSDSATAVAANLNALQALSNTVHTITFTDSGTPNLSVTATQLIADAATLLKISGPYTITLPGPATAAQATAASSTLDSHLTTGFAVSDTAANVIANLDGLQTLVTAGKLASVTLNDATTPTLAVTAATLLADAGALALVNGSWRLAVSSGTVTAAQATALAGAVTTHLNGGLAVLDSAANVSGSLDALQGLGSTVASIALNDGSSPALTMTATQLVNDAPALLKVSGSFGITVTDNPTAAQAAAVNDTLRGHLATGLTVSDSAANVTASLDALQALTAATKLASITLTDSSAPTLSVTAAQLVADAGTLALTGPSWSLAVTGAVTAAQAVALSSAVTSHLATGLAVSDTAANVSSSIDNLETLGSTVLSIALTDTTPALSLTAAQFLADAATLGKISNSSYSVTLSGTLTVAQAATLDGQGLLAKVSGGAAISDIATNVEGVLDTLQGYGSRVASIALTDGSTPTINVTAAALVSDNATLAKISGAWDLTVSSGTLTAADAATLSNSVLGHLTANLAVSDTAANVVTSLDALQARHASLAPITLSDSGTPALSITAAKLVADSDALLLITPPFTIALSGALTEAQAATADTQGLLALVTSGAAISDTAANVQGSLGALQGLGAEVGSIALTDGGTPTISITSATLVADATTVGKITGGYHLTIGPDAVTAAQATAISSGIATHLTNGFTISDSAANVTSSIAGLQTLAAGNRLASIALTGGGTPTISLNAADVIADASALTRITGSWQLAVSSGAFNATQAALLVNNGLSAHLTGTIDVSDSAARMMANIGALQQLSATSHLGAMTLTTSPPAFNVTVAQATNDVAAINAILGATGANARQVLYVNGTSSGDTVNTSAIAHAVNISLGGNSATMSFVSGAATVSGTADNVTVGNAAGARIQDTISSGTEVITGFQLGRDTLDLALNNADPSTLTVTDVTMGGTAAVSLALSGDPTHGVILMNPGVNAASLQDDNIFTAGSHVLIS